MRTYSKNFQAIVNMMRFFSWLKEAAKKFTASNNF